MGWFMIGAILVDLPYEANPGKFLMVFALWGGYFLLDTALFGLFLFKVGK